MYFDLLKDVQSILTLWISKKKHLTLVVIKGEKCEGLRVDLGGDCNYYGNTFTADSTSYTEGNLI